MSYTGKAIDLSKYDKYDKNVELKSNNVMLSLGDDLRKAENSLKTALLSYGDLKDKFDVAKKNFKQEADKAFDVAIKFNSQANDLGFKALDNPSFKMIDAYLASDLYRNLNK
jgi:hypothetical protein